MRSASDTPIATAPSSPRIRATTIDVPGLTSSKVSPDGRISNRDIGAKLVIVMVGLPARGKSYVTKKLARYLNWLQHDTKIFNVGNRRRIAAGAGGDHVEEPPSPGTNEGTGLVSPDAFTRLDSYYDLSPKSSRSFNAHRRTNSITTSGLDGGMDQSAEFFDPKNKVAADLREKVALETLEELLNFIMEGGGSVGILDATNSTRKRRKAIVDRIRQVAGNELGIIFLESECHDEKLLEANMRLKLQGPDYKGTDPAVALEDFKRRVTMYESSYEPLGDFEERLGMPYIKMIDVGRKIVTHQIRGFLAGQTVYFLLNFHLSARQIWITRHGESHDNVAGRIGGDASLSDEGKRYASALAQFIEFQRKRFHDRQLQKHAMAHLPPRFGDSTPPNPEYTGCCQEDEQGRPLEKNFCVWTSMLKRSIETATDFDEDVYDVKQMRMLNELNAGMMEGHTYEEIRQKWPEDFALRRKDKLHYRYPGAGGESYLDVINRLRAVIVEVERMQDHVLLVAHRVVARVLLAYFLGLKREDVASLDVPLGILYMLEPKPYGVDFKAYKYNPETSWFDELENFELKNEEQKHVEPTIY
ncbi:bifunctional 6-phosphofructo-2-kinase/fructose-2,6-bisphosphate 2-phosphatase [Ascodesmis nigricans]|uniref:Bifunctional 6-phosphofructo-2-kinase/fructose-2,6-bisphosphate 2-phosphatase n=1 Tax=Ascodesmis nigricans TaxID=341454 RepID=A0A4S2ML73_9PEZI|nr:bifunctional 6-phosphofructo-2-kinase/fructose-2,6-bisphosphate 2-phosphatase [Ascodesmis nigricans]